MSEACTLEHLKDTLCLDSIGSPTVEVTVEAVLLLVAFAILALAADHLCDSMETLCDHWGLPEEIGGATFMAFGGAVPEITVNSMATMKAISQGAKGGPADAALGIGAILGSGLLAFLTVPAICSIANQNKAPLLLKRRPLTRDVLFYGASVLVLLHALRTSISAKHGLCLLLIYAVYVTTLCYGDQVRSWYTQWRVTHRHGVAAAMEPSKTPEGTADFQSFREFRKKANNKQSSVFREKYDEELALPLIETGTTPSGTAAPQKASVLDNLQADFDRLVRPLERLIDLTCPDCRIYQPRENLYLLTFVVSFLWVGLASSLIGCVVDRWVTMLQNPSSSGFFGLVLVALGAEIPDAINALTASSRGYGSMAAASCVGSQIINICVGLGLPWALSVLASGSVPVSSASCSFLKAVGSVNAAVASVLAAWLIWQGRASGASQFCIVDRRKGLAMLQCYLGVISLFGLLTFAGVFGVEGKTDENDKVTRVCFGHRQPPRQPFPSLTTCHIYNPKACCTAGHDFIIGDYYERLGTRACLMSYTSLKELLCVMCDPKALTLDVVAGTGSYINIDRETGDLEIRLCEKFLHTFWDDGVTNDLDKPTTRYDLCGLRTCAPDSEDCERFSTIVPGEVMLNGSYRMENVDDFLRFMEPRYPNLWTEGIRGAVKLMRVADDAGIPCKMPSIADEATSVMSVGLPILVAVVGQLLSLLLV
ncbi:hypothetical protein FOL47_006195 [Perkinsus chesapeaki]|uniref:Sodium/calcium exchanger membrane region domain-containing protein n=1 Tax=Perkinsus chesapeaki TaxID=330153 RepID=A0A7J6LTS5_PERCH|nr:hypothetical protein FOL47_006195 [Perkinsus chesapeaki]